MGGMKVGRLPLMRGWSEREPTGVAPTGPEVMDAGSPRNTGFPHWFPHFEKIKFL